MLIGNLPDPGGGEVHVIGPEAHRAATQPTPGYQTSRGTEWYYRQSGRGPAGERATFRPSATQHGHILSGLNILQTAPLGEDSDVAALSVCSSLFCALTHEVPLSVGDVSGDISLDHLQVQRPAAVRPRAELQVAALHIKGKPADVDVAGALKYS